MPLSTLQNAKNRWNVLNRSERNVKVVFPHQATPSKVQAKNSCTEITRIMLANSNRRLILSSNLAAICQRSAHLQESTNPIPPTTSGTAVVFLKSLKRREVTNKTNRHRISTSVALKSLTVCSRVMMSNLCSNSF